MSSFLRSLSSMRPVAQRVLRTCGVLKRGAETNQQFHHLSHHQSLTLSRVSPVSAAAIVLHKQPMSSSVAQYDVPRTGGRPADIQGAVNRIQSTLGRNGNIAKDNLLELYNLMTSTGIVSGSHVLIALRSCGNALAELPAAERTQLVHQIWNSLEQLGCMFDTSHYNTMLSVLIQNEHEFSPTEFLANMESNDVEPNRATYQHLVAGYCTRGDIEGARKILEHMKEKGYPVTESVFNSLINGHAQSDDMSSAEGILNIMRSAGMQPSANTYTTLLCSFVKKGDMENYGRIMSESSESGVTLMDRHLLKLYYHLVLAGQTEEANNIQEKMMKQAVHKQDIINISMNLTTLGHVEAAYQLVKMLPMISEAEFNSEETFQHRGAFFISHLVKTNQPVERVVAYTQRMREDGLHTDAVIIALSSALQCKRADMVFALCRRMKEDGVPVRPHYFWPLLAETSSARNLDSTMKILTDTLEFCEPDADTLTNYVIPLVEDQSYLDVVAMMKSIGVPITDDITVALIRNEINRGRVGSAAEILAENRVPFSQLRTNLVSTFSNNPDSKGTTTLLNVYSADATPTNDPVGQFLLTLLENNETGGAGEMNNLNVHLETLLKELRNEGCLISSQANYRQIQEILTENELPGLKRIVYQLRTRYNNMDSSRPAARVGQYYENMDSLEERLAAVLSDGANADNLLRQLISAQAYHGNLDKSMQYKGMLEENGGQLTAGNYAYLIDASCKAGKHDMAVELKTAMESNQEFILDMNKYQRLIESAVRNGKKDQALQFFHELKDRQIPMTEANRSLLFHTVNNIAQMGDVELTKTVIDTVFELQLSPVTPNILSTLPSVFLDGDDVGGLLDVAEYCIAKYRLLPRTHDIFVKFINASDLTSLQRIMDLSSEIRGEMNMLYDLLFAFVWCGKTEQARKIVETPGLRAVAPRIKWFTDKCVADNKPAELETFLDLSKNLFDCDRNKIYWAALELCDRGNDWENALKLWDKSQEEEFIPSNAILKKLGEILLRNNQAVPFEIPEDIDTKEGDIVSHEPNTGKKSGINRNMRSFLDRGLVDDAWTLREDLRNNSGTPIDNNTNSSFIRKFVQTDQLAQARSVFTQMLEEGSRPLDIAVNELLSAYANKGDIEGLKTTGEEWVAGNFMKRPRLPINKYILLSYVNRNDIDLAVDYIRQELAGGEVSERQMGTRAMFSRLISIGVDNDIEKVRSLVQELSERGSMRQAYDLFYAFVEHDRFYEAEKLLIDIPMIKSAHPEWILGFIAQLSKRVADDNDLKRLSRAVALVEPAINDKTVLYRYLIKSYSVMDQCDNAMNLYQKLLTEGLDIDEIVKKNLAECLKRNGKPVPFDEPPESYDFYAQKYKSGRFAGQQ